MKRYRDTYYLVTNTGEVYSEKTKRFIKPWLRNGYKVVHIEAKLKALVHRMVAELYCNGYDPSLDVIIKMEIN
jgi:hypothetical protein